MRYLIGAAMLLASLLPAAAQKMNADDVKWVNQCIDDNKNEKGGTPAIVRVSSNNAAEIGRAYCACMNEKMDENETRSITQWEKSHPNERKACERQAGWK